MKPVKKIEAELNQVLQNLYSALTVASEAALLIDENDLSEDLLALRGTLGVKSPPKTPDVKTKLYHPHHAHHHRQKHTHKHH